MPSPSTRAATEHQDAFWASQKLNAERHVAKAFPWLRRMWEEDQGETQWGYAVLVHPDAFANDQEAEDYLLRRDGVLFHARGAIGLGNCVISNMWRLQRLDWPANMAEDVTHDSRAVGFRRLRQHFKSILDQSCTKRTKETADTSTPTQPGRGGLSEGLLQNVFLLIDKESAASVLSKPGLVDDMWVWAIDPDYSAKTPTIETPGYKGYMRVRLQQLVNNFYDVRRFHHAEYPMAKLWQVAQKSEHQAFVSLKDHEARSRNMDRFIGSAMRAQPPSVVYGPRKVELAGSDAFSA